MTVLAIFGAGGMIGRVVIRPLLAADESLRIVAVSRQADPAFAGLSRCEPIQGDVFDRDSLDRVVRRADLVVNLAARNPVGIEQDWAARRDFFSGECTWCWIGRGVGAAARRASGSLLNRVGVRNCGV